MSEARCSANHRDDRIPRVPLVSGLPRRPSRRRSLVWTALTKNRLGGDQWGVSFWLVRASRTGALLVFLVACATTPVSLSDLEGREYSDVEAVLDDLGCASAIMVTHIGTGASREQEVLEAARVEVRMNTGADVEQARQRGEHIWVFANASSRVLGALDTRGGMAFCE